MTLPATNNRPRNPLLSPSNVLALYDATGLRGTCGLNCYQASSPPCTCICQGRHHGVGYENAKRMAAALLYILAKEWALATLITDEYLTVTIDGSTWFAKPLL